MDNQNPNNDSVVSETARAYAPEEGKRYTYADYCTWGEDYNGKPDFSRTWERYELIYGVAYHMSSPNRRHQEISRELLLQIGNYLKGKSCKVYAAPSDVRLFADEADDTVVQPDIYIVCDHSKLTDAGCTGAPDMAIEILSPGSIQHDRFRKLKLYERVGVREYWIVEPEGKLVTVYILKDGRYGFGVYTDTDTVRVSIFDDLTINLPEIFAE